MASKTGYHHLTFDDAVRGPAEKASDREKLRNKLVDVGQRFIGFDKAVEEDTIKRRTNEVKRLKEAHEGANKLEKALNCEIKRRVDANKQVQGLTEHLANDMLDKLSRTSWNGLRSSPYP